MPKKKAPSPAELLEQVRKRPYRGGVPCQTCNHPKAREINAYLRDLHEKSLQEGRFVSPQRIIDAALRPAFNYTLKSRALLRHMEDCLGLER